MHFGIFFEEIEFGNILFIFLILKKDHTSRDSNKGHSNKIFTIITKNNLNI